MLPLLFLSAVQGAKVHWWLGSYNAAYAPENRKFISAHRNLVDGVLHCCTGLSIDDSGGLAAPPTFMSSLIVADHESGIGTTYVPVGPSENAVMSGVAGRAASSIAAWTVKANVSGVLSDYEPRQNTTSEHARRYAEYLVALSTALHRVDKRLVVCISDWGILGPAHWLRLASAKADYYTSMGSTYYRKGPGDIYGEAVVTGMLAAFPRESLIIGIGSAAPPSCPNACIVDDYKWDGASLLNFLSNLEAKGIGSIVVWLTDIAALLVKSQAHYCGVDEWMLPPLAAFRRGNASATSGAHEALPMR
jgi:hypothetical protein